MADYNALPDQDLQSNEKLLPRHSEDSEERVLALPERKSKRWRTRWLMLGHGAIELVLIAVIAYLATRSNDTKLYNSQINFTPARDAIRYETRTFNAGYLPGEKSEFQLDCDDCKPNDRIDDAWASMYEGYMWAKIPRSQAAQLRNLTINIPGNEDHYLVGLDVFHQLHCLDNVRKALWPDRYKPEDHMGGQNMSLLSPKHVDHCLDQLRQSIQCQSDLSTNWLFWDPDFESNMAARDVEHSCRSFDSVLDWAKEHKQKPFDLSIKLEDPLKTELAKGE